MGDNAIAQKKKHKGIQFGDIGIHSDMELYSEFYKMENSKMSDAYRNDVKVVADYLKYNKNKDIILGKDPLQYKNYNKKRGIFEKKRLEKDATKYMENATKLDELDLNNEPGIIGEEKDLLSYMNPGLSNSYESDYDEKFKPASLGDVKKLKDYNGSMPDSEIASNLNSLGNGTYFDDNKKTFEKTQFNPLFLSYNSELKKLVNPDNIDPIDYSVATIQLNRFKMAILTKGIEGDTIDKDEIRSDLERMCGTLERKLKFRYLKEKNRI